MQASCGEAADQTVLPMSELNIMTSFKNQLQPRTDGYALVLQEEEGEIYILGNAASINLFSNDPVRKNCDLLLCEEMLLEENGNLKVGRRLNGDESSRIGFNKPGFLHIRYFLYE